MREVNFSIPNVNKASVGITTALYDRRALDCTSTLPLINSLNHLAYLTTSSARIRDILTVDGGVERLVCILKTGRSKDMMEMWKWNLAFQCVVNIGVRGSENVRTRVVEADMVPVIATILDNYIKIMDRCKEKGFEPDSRRGQHRTTSKTQPSRLHNNATAPASFSSSNNRITSESRGSRRQAPPPSIEIPAPFPQPQASTDPNAMDITPTAPQFAVTSPPERTTFSQPSHTNHIRHMHHHHRSQDARPFESVLDTTVRNVDASRLAEIAQPLATAMPSMDVADGFSLRPVRDIDRLPSMVPGIHSGITSQPESPTTPNPPIQTAVVVPSVVSRRRPSIRHQRSMSGTSDDVNADDIVSDGSTGAETAEEPMVDIQTGIELPGMEAADTLLDSVETPIALTAQEASEAQGTETFDITHHSANGSIITHANAAPAVTPLPFPPFQTPVAAGQVPTGTNFSRRSVERPAYAFVASVPRDEDVLMSLQLLAYVSKYCNLRSYFQNSHLVPKLEIAKEICMNDEDFGTPLNTNPEEMHEEYLLPDDFNIFPLVEKFTVRHHPQDMKYWAGVVMRNLCRKDDSRGGIRQCAYYECGKWEEYTRQFAKCRRCRRTKYCSKDCQKSAWLYHRHWCVAVNP
ncbi:MAG: hypothetical protein M1814_003107 [Vezdaea aestivalis]|nr:MAG: hypothetical protein M1814_003107 [Vezdaea aestivalis]